MDETGKILRGGAYGVGKSKLLKEIVREKIRAGYNIITVIGISPDKSTKISGQGHKD